VRRCEIKEESPSFSEEKEAKRLLFCTRAEIPAMASIVEAAEGNKSLLLLFFRKEESSLPRLCGRNPSHAFLTDSRIGICSNHCVTGIREPDMLTKLTEREWLIVLQVFDAAQSRRGEPGHDDRKFLEAIHYFTVHSITWRALPSHFGNWNSIWKRFWRLSRSGVFEAFFQLLAGCSQTAHLIQFFDSTTARAHVSAAGAKGGGSVRISVCEA
jgi:transposase